jgi:hypothetical protein
MRRRRPPIPPRPRLQVRRGAQKLFKVHG